MIQNRSRHHRHHLRASKGVLDDQRHVSSSRQPLEATHQVPAGYLSTPGHDQHHPVLVRHEAEGALDRDRYLLACREAGIQELEEAELLQFAHQNAPERQHLRNGRHKCHIDHGTTVARAPDLLELPHRLALVKLEYSSPLSAEEQMVGLPEGTAPQLLLGVFIRSRLKGLHVRLAGHIVEAAAGLHGGRQEKVWLPVWVLRDDQVTDLLCGHVHKVGRLHCLQVNVPHSVAGKQVLRRLLAHKQETVRPRRDVHCERAEHNAGLT